MKCLQVMNIHTEAEDVKGQIRDYETAMFPTYIATLMAVGWINFEENSVLYNMIRFNIIIEWVKFNRLPIDPIPVTPAPAPTSSPPLDSTTGLAQPPATSPPEYVLLSDIDGNGDDIAGGDDSDAAAEGGVGGEEGFDMSLAVDLHKKVQLRASLVPFLGCQCLAINVAFTTKDYTRVELNAVDFVPTDNDNGADLERLPHGKIDDVYF